MVGHPAGELRRARQELDGQRAHRRRHAALLGKLRTGRRQGAHLQPIVLPASARALTGAPDSIADAYWAICNERPDAWREEYRFAGAQKHAASTS
jgi:hypothetical protein